MSAPECDLCSGSGEMTWRQPTAGPDGVFRLVEMSHPCVNGCSGWYRLPAAERADVVDGPSGEIGNVARANAEHRTEWFLPPGVAD
ncbi:hypothetical protein [Lentzea sp. NPDC003310]|uniref:hypothetical protein n=1 Tax=Lentzea sp. NPDC003310 TaxID=3154447 RepID=UPI0033BD9DF9